MYKMITTLCWLFATSLLLQLAEAGSCTPGFYGPSCEMNCSKHCLSSDCEADASRGTFRCSQGCIDGWTGNTCERKCPRGCKSCNWTSGACSADCLPERCGDNCDQFCITGAQPSKPNCQDSECTLCLDGWYGVDCKTPCPKHCETGCNKTSGVCDHQCVKGHHGLYCSKPCTSTCNDGCRQSDGVCIGGCHKGWHGPRCNVSCSNQCHDGTCYQVSGKCADTGIVKPLALSRSRCKRVWVNGLVTSNCSVGCEHGWRGDRCDQPCPEQCYSCSRYPDGQLCIYSVEVISIKKYGVDQTMDDGFEMRLVYALLLVIPPFLIVGVMQLLRVGYEKYKRCQDLKKRGYVVNEPKTVL